MARSKRMAEEEQDLNLAPIMNMVIILIPLLLLSVVFLKVGVINITAPKLSVGPPSAEPPDEEKKPLNLTVAIGVTGLRVAAEGGQLPPIAGCPADGPTVCLRKDANVDVAAQFTQARKIMDSGNAGALTEGQVELEKGIQAYDWRELYNLLSGIKQKFPDETIMNVSADPDIPFSMIVRMMDVARYRLEKDAYPAQTEFWEAKAKKKVVDGKEVFSDLFSDPVLAVAQ